MPRAGLPAPAAARLTARRFRAAPRLRMQSGSSPLQLVTVSGAALAFRLISAAVEKFAGTLHPHIEPFAGTTFGVYLLLVRAVERTAGPLLTSRLSPTLVVSWLAFAAAMALLLRLAQLDLDDGHAEAAVLLAAVFPSAAAFQRNGAEAVFLLFAVGACYAFRKQRWMIGGLCGACAAATLPTGIFLVPALAAIGLRSEARGRIPVLFGLCVAIAGLLAYLSYLYYRGGPPGGWEVSVTRWGFRFSEPPWRAVQRAFVQQPPASFAIVNNVLASIAVASIPLVWWRLNAGYAIYMIGMLLVPMTSGRDDLLGPTCALLFPVCILAAGIRPRVVVALLIIASSMLYALGLAFS